MDTEEAHLAYSVADVCRVASIGRTALYEAIGSGALRAVKHGRRTLVLAHDLRTWLERLPSLKDSEAQGNNPTQLKPR
jgi:excisionase family DNA binding protein